MNTQNSNWYPIDPKFVFQDNEMDSCSTKKDYLEYTPENKKDYLNLAQLYYETNSNEMNS